MRNTNKIIMRIKLGFLALFIAISAGILVYGHYYEVPRRKCEANGHWWNDKYRSCEVPIYLPVITGRKPGEPRQVTWPSEESARVSNPSAKPKTPTAPAETPSSAN